MCNHWLHNTPFSSVTAFSHAKNIYCVALDGQSIDTSNIGFHAQNEGKHNKTNTTKNIKKMSKTDRTETGDEHMCCQRVSSIVTYKTRTV